MSDWRSVKAFLDLYYMVGENYPKDESSPDFTVREIEKSTRGLIDEKRTQFATLDEAIAYLLTRLGESTGLYIQKPNGTHHRFSDVLEQLYDGQYHVEDQVGPYLICPTDLLRPTFESWALGIDIEKLANRWLSDCAAYDERVRHYDEAVEDMIDLLISRVEEESDASRFKHMYPKRDRERLRQIIGAARRAPLGNQVELKELMAEYWQRTLKIATRPATSKAA